MCVCVNEGVCVGVCVWAGVEVCVVRTSMEQWWYQHSHWEQMLSWDEICCYIFILFQSIPVLFRYFGSTAHEEFAPILHIELDWTEEDTKAESHVVFLWFKIDFRAVVAVWRAVCVLYDLIEYTQSTFSQTIKFKVLERLLYLLSPYRVVTCQSTHRELKAHSPPFCFTIYFPLL